MSTGGTPRSVVVIGGGLAGLRTLAELRTQGFDGTLTWLGNEGVGAYDRPPLSKELLTRADPLWLSEDLEVSPQDLADAVHLDRPASALQPEEERVVVQTEAGPLVADAVVLAMGAAPISPWPAARVLHTLVDAEALRPELRSGQRVVIIGAGWIGAEVAGVAAAAGCEVTVLEAGPAPLWRQLGVAAGERTRAWYDAAAVLVRTGVTVADVAEGQVLLPDGGPLAADVVLSAVGVKPQTAWLGDAVPVLPSGHVRVTRGGRSSVPGIWAVGDLAVRGTLHFGPQPGGHWFAALRDPALVAADILGHELPETEAAPEVFSDQLGHHLEVLGVLTREDEPGAQRLTREHEGGWVDLHLRGDTLVGAVVADAPREVSPIRKLLRDAALPRLDLAAAADPSIPIPRAVR